MRSVLLVFVVSCAHADKQAWSDGTAMTPVGMTSASAGSETPATREPPPPPAEEQRCRLPVEPVRMDLVRADVRQVLQALADRGRINLVLADDVGGQVTVRLEDVPIDEALVAIATAAGLALDTDRCVTTVASRPSR